MAETVRLPLTVEIGDLFQDLESVQIGLGQLLRDALAETAEVVAPRAAQLFPRGPGPRENAKNPNDRLPHVAGTISGRGYQTYAAVLSDHPAAGVLVWGGSISPNGAEIRFLPGQQPQRAFEQLKPRIAAHLQDRIDRLVADHLS